MRRLHYDGVFPVLYAFFDAAGGLDRAQMRAQVEHCIACGAAGITVLGLVTEVHKLDVNERRALVESVGALIAGRVRYLVTVAEPSVEGQIAFSHAAAAAGADAAILQPPPVKGMTEVELVRFLGRVADAAEVDVGIQNNPVNLDVALSPAALAGLARRHPNITLFKAEGAGVDVAEAASAFDARISVLGGHGGLEYLSLLRAGGHGLIPAPDFLRPQVRLHALWRQGSPAARAEAARLHAAILPAIVFMSRSVPGMLCYGKRLLARQIGLPEPVDRAPAAVPTAFGLAELDLLECALAEAAEGR